MVPKFLIRIGGDPADWNKALGKVTDDAKRTSTLVSKIMSGAIAGISVAGIAAFVGRTVDGIDRLNDLADVTGSSIGKLSQLEDTALRTGNSFESMEGSLVRLNKVLKDSDGRDQTAADLRSIGLSVEALKRLDPVDAFEQIARAFDRYSDGPTKARLAQDLFAKSITEVAPLLKDLADKGLGVASVTDEQAKAAERYNQQLAGLSKNALDVQRALVSELLPSLSATAQALNTNIKQDGTLLGVLKTLGQGISQRLGLDDLSILRREAALTSAAITDTVRAIETYQDGLNNDPGNARYAERLVVLRKRYDELQKQAAKTSAALKGQADDLVPLTYDDVQSRRMARAGDKPKIKDPGRIKPQSAADPLAEADKRMQDALEKYIERDIELEERRTQEQQQQLNQRLLAAGDFALQLQDQTAELTANLIIDERGRAQALLELDRQRMADQIDAMGLNAEQTDRLYEQLNANIVARQALLNEQLKPEWQRMLDGWRDTMRLMSDSADRLNTGFIAQGEDAFADWVRNGKLNTRSLTDFIVSEFARLAYKRYLAQSVASLGESIFGALAGFLGGAAGATNGNAGQNYSGQVVNNPSAYVAPPMATGTNYIPYDGFLARLHKGEAVVPEKYNPAAGGGQAAQPITMNQTITVGAGVSPGEVFRIVGIANAKLREDLMRSRRRDGGFS